MTNRINNPRTNSDKPLSTGDIICVIGVAMMTVIAGTIIAVKKCTGEKPDQPKIEAPATPIPEPTDASKNSPAHLSASDTTTADMTELEKLCANLFPVLPYTISFSK